MACHSDGGRPDLSDKQGDSAVFIYLCRISRCPLLGKVRLSEASPRRDISPGKSG